jgi:hypothetical protein
VGERRGRLRRPGRRAPELAQHRLAARPLGRIEAQQRGAQRGQLGRRVGRERRRRRRLVLLLVEEDLHDRAVERHLPGQPLVEHHADRVPVGGGTGGLAGRLLGRHVVRRADDVLPRPAVARHRVGEQPEVEHDDAALLGDQHVRRLDVAVHLAGGVQRDQRAPELDQPMAQLALVAGGPGQEVLAAHQLHREEQPPLLLVELAERDQVRVLEILERAELVLEVRDRLRVDVAQRLERHLRAAIAVPRLVDVARRSAADAAHDPEPRRMEGGRIHGRSSGYCTVRRERA